MPRSRGARDELRRFAGIEPAAPPAGFVGQLRDYQREGLGWIHFLRQFGFGGCLADDMGTGKTIQVLALLEARRELRGGRETRRRGRAGATRPRPVAGRRAEVARVQLEAGGGAVHPRAAGPRSHGRRAG